MAQRTCEQPGCTKPHLAKGCCSSHYNQRMPASKRHPKATVPCVVCATPVVRRTDRRRAPTCSVECRATAQFGHAHAPRDGYDWQRDAVRRARTAPPPSSTSTERTSSSATLGSALFAESNAPNLILTA